jgi:hypothetical protein
MPLQLPALCRTSRPTAASHRSTAGVQADQIFGNENLQSTARKALRMACHSAFRESGWKSTEQYSRLHSGRGKSCHKLVWHREKRWSHIVWQSLAPHCHGTVNERRELRKRTIRSCVIEDPLVNHTRVRTMVGADTQRRAPCTQPSRAASLVAQGLNRQ